MPMQQHFVTFYSPGTFIAETTQQQIASWDVNQAMKMAHAITERYGATPYGFRFTTRERADDELDSKVVAQSPTYFLGGLVETLEQVKARNTGKDNILISNMEGNGYRKVVTNNNSWRWTQQLHDSDVVLNWKPKRKKAARRPRGRRDAD